MCCFSGTVEHVGDTKIFVRTHHDGTEFLVYQMTYTTEDDVAMILPLPTVKNPKDDAVSFIDLSNYPEFFVDLEKGFPKLKGRGAVGGIGSGSFGGGEFKPELKVVDVGKFEASFVPTVKDFSRLDERFRLPDTLWTQTLPRYKDWGFAVFKLKKDSQHVHPMAFSFPRREPAKAFFPTMHIHDGTAPEMAEFDHVLYGQFFGGNRFNYMNWQESPQPAAQFMALKKTAGILDGGAHVYKKTFGGKHPNRDIIL